MEYFFSAVTVLYLLLHLYLLSGLIKSIKIRKGNQDNKPEVSLIVAARNENDNIASCIKSLAKINYPESLLEIILVNDNSTDDTFEIMSKESKGKDFFRVINSRINPEGNLKGKANALDTAIEICSGTVIITTDADCTVNPEWAKTMTGYYDNDTGMVCGFTGIRQDGTLFTSLQNLDWMYLLALASSSAGLNHIMSCLGNNLSFTKKAYYDTGGYKSISFSVTEDLALMRKIDSSGKYKIRFPVDDKCLAETLPCKNLKELFSQKRRWFRGGTGINLLGYITGFELYTMNLMLVSGFFFMDIQNYLMLIVVKSFSELILLSVVLKKFNSLKQLIIYPVFILYFAFYGLLLPLSFLFSRKINWKGRKF
ncbi:MAG: hypothetical protein HGGPFJEG_01394 [Ignavibacteria bacterium]|nr:hypothetical protein [Ignavibacteria bacterium]